MKIIQEFDSFDGLNEGEGDFDVARLAMSMKRAAKILDSGDAEGFVTFFQSNLASMLSSPEARERAEFIDKLAEGIEAARVKLPVEKRRYILDALMPGLVEQCDKDPALKAAYDI